MLLIHKLQFQTKPELQDILVSVHTNNVCVNFKAIILWIEREMVAGVQSSTAHLQRAIPTWYTTPVCNGWCMTAWVYGHLAPRVEPETRVVIVNHKSQTNMHYILQSDWSFLVLVNIQVVYTVNKVAYRKHCFTTSCDIWNRIYNFLLVQEKKYPLKAFSLESFPLYCTIEARVKFILNNVKYFPHSMSALAAFDLWPLWERSKQFVTENMTHVHDNVDQRTKTEE